MIIFDKDLLNIMPANSIAVNRENGNLQFMTKDSVEGRSDKVAWLITQACKDKRAPDNFAPIVFSLSDKPTSLDRFLEIKESIPYYQPCTSDFTDYSYTYPDYFFKDCDNYGIADYEEARIRLMSRGVSKPSMSALGWLGAPTSDVRRNFVKMARELGADKLYYRSITWESDFQTQCPEKYMSMDKQAGLFKYLLDMPGVGYSPRLKLQLFSFRPVFVVDRPWREFFYKDLVPWETHVPVKSDLSDLVENLDRLDSDRALQRSIVSNASDFCTEHLTRDSAITRYLDIFSTHAL